MTRLQQFAVGILLIWASVARCSEKTSSPIIGDVEQTHPLAAENSGVRGIAVDDSPSGNSRLLTLDKSGKIFVYDILREQGGQLKLERVVDLPKGPDGKRLSSPRGLALTRENNDEVVYFLNWSRSAGGQSQLWRLQLDVGGSSFVDLSRHVYRIGDRELLGVAHRHGELLVSFDGSEYFDRNMRVRRGIIQLHRHDKNEFQPEFVRHLPDSGTMASQGLACMELSGTSYLWGTVGTDHIYCAEGTTGRGLFHFDAPPSSRSDNTWWDLSFGDGALWISEDLDGVDCVHRVNVSRNPDASRIGPRILRHLVMTIRSEPKGEHENAGHVYHTYSRPYAHDQMPNQGIWEETEKITVTSEATDATIRDISYNPAGDRASRQHMRVVEYTDGSSKQVSSKYEVELWTNPYRKYVYPHRANRDVTALEGTDYLADDPELFNLKDTETYASFIERVKLHIRGKYNVRADLDNPYWAARNVLEYLQDHYYYPNREKRKPAAVDYSRRHYDANPGNLKIELSERDYDKSQIIACSGTSVMVTGALRYLGIPARWLGTGTEQDADTWDSNQNGILDRDESAPCTNGHRYAQVWLGSRYGWVCFDATPKKPEFNDYDPPPPLQTQWRFMNRCAAGHLRDKRIVFNVGSQLCRPLYRDYLYDEELAVDNNCGGDQRYNIQGRYDFPELWNLSRHRISVANVLFIDDVNVAGPTDKTRVTWKLDGLWRKDPAATLTVCLQRLDPGGRPIPDVENLAAAIKPDVGSVEVGLAKYAGQRCRILIYKAGDPETGGISKPFVVE